MMICCVFMMCSNLISNCPYLPSIHQLSPAPSISYQHKNFHSIKLKFSEQASIAKLNHDMASQMLQSYKYTSAYKLSKMAVSLLPDDSWSSQYHLSLEYYFSLSKAAYSCGNADEAKVRISMVPLLKYVHLTILIISNNRSML